MDKRTKLRTRLDRIMDAVISSMIASTIMQSVIVPIIAYKAPTPVEICESARDQVPSMPTSKAAPGSKHA